MDKRGLISLIVHQRSSRAMLAWLKLHGLARDGETERSAGELVKFVQQGRLDVDDEFDLEWLRSRAAT